MSECKYCMSYKPIIDTFNIGKHADMYGIDLVIEDNKLKISAAVDTYEPGYEEAEVKIKYCPICGRKLEKEDE